MPTIPELLSAAVDHHQAGRLDEAKQLYRQVLAADPQQANAWHLLGLIAATVGRHDIAIDHIQRAIAIAGDQAGFFSSLGAVYSAVQNLDQAGEALARAVALDPGFAMAHYNLGVVRQKQGRTAEAMTAYRNALAAAPDYTDAHNNLAILYADAENWNGAATEYAEVVRLDPGRASAHHGLGLALAELHRTDEAIRAYQRALEIEPSREASILNLAGLHETREEWDQAETLYRRLLECTPINSYAYFGLGLVCQSRKEYVKAEEWYQKYVSLVPDDASGWNNLGQVLTNLSMRDHDAGVAFQRALSLDAGMLNSLCSLGNIHMRHGQFREAAEYYQRATEASPGFTLAECTLVYLRMMMCQWVGVEDLSRRVLAEVDREGPRIYQELADPFMLTALPVPATPAQLDRAARQWADHYLTFQGDLPPRPVDRGHARIRVGYLSADFRLHPVAMLIAGLIEQHDRNAFEIRGYSYGPKDDSPIRQRLKDAFDDFIELDRRAHEESAARIAADEIDILVDLTGHTANASPEILMYRPAPVQVNYLGYPGTMGSPHWDYIVVDDTVVPESEQPYFVEQLVHLPGCYQVNDSQRAIVDTTPTREKCGLPAEGFVFCSFNNVYKTTPDMFAVWMRLLQQVPGSTLWLYAANADAPGNLRREAEARGVSGDRLVFAPLWPMSEHLARYRLADLFLDTLPYNSHTTGSDALWAGCPLVTVKGNSFAGRVAASQLTTLGLPELITSNLAEYEALALALARDRERLAAIRARLATARAESSLFDSTRFARWLEDAFRTMWSRARAGEKPRPIRVR